jgi:D-alanyl-lipoteichoic acid acyltransferase DltB (MBOAT superfamily)
MVMAGLWHGANWTFIVFGAIHGGVMVIERLLVGVDEKPAAAPNASVSWVWARRILTFNLFCLTLICFRAASVSAALQFLSGLGKLAWRKEYISCFVMLSIFALPLFAVDLFLEETGQEYLFAQSPYAVRTALAAAAFVVLTLFSGIDPNAFIYFRF